MNKALCIGINYPGTNMQLSGCVNDAKDWAKALKNRGFVVATMLDAKATGDAMRKAFANIVANTEVGDNILIQYSGHGTYVPDTNDDEPDGRDEALVPYDVMDNGPLIDDEIYSIFRNILEVLRDFFHDCFSQELRWRKKFSNAKRWQWSAESTQDSP